MPNLLNIGRNENIITIITTKSKAITDNAIIESVYIRKADARNLYFIDDESIDLKAVALGAYLSYRLIEVATENDALAVEEG